MVAVGSLGLDIDFADRVGSYSCDPFDHVGGKQPVTVGLVFHWLP